MATYGPFRCDVITPFRKAASVEAVEVKAPAVGGEVDILPGHTSYLTLLVSGPLSLKDTAGKVHHFACHGGFLQVGDNGVVILADKVESLDELDPAEVEKQRHESEQILKSISFTSADYAKAVSNIEENRTRARVVKNKMN